MVIEMRAEREERREEGEKERERESADQGEDFEQVFGNRIEGLVLLYEKRRELPESESVKCCLGD